MRSGQRGDGRIEPQGSQRAQRVGAEHTDRRSSRKQHLFLPVPGGFKGSNFALCTAGRGIALKPHQGCALRDDVLGRSATGPDVRPLRKNRGGGVHGRRAYQPTRCTQGRSDAGNGSSDRSQRRRSDVIGPNPADDSRERRTRRPGAKTISRPPLPFARLSSVARTPDLSPFRLLATRYSLLTTLLAA